MRIAVVNVAAASGGALSILEDAHCFALAHSEHGWLFLIGRAHLPAASHIDVIHNPRIKSSWLHRLRWERGPAAHLVREWNADVVLSLQNTALRRCPCPQVVYLHQAIPFAEGVRFSLWRREERLYAFYQKFYRKLMIRSVNKAAASIVQSNWMRHAIIAILPDAAGRIHVIPPSVDLPGTTPLPAFAEGETHRFFYPAYPYLYKNHAVLIEAMALLQREGITDFTVTCTARGDETQTIRRLAHQAETQGLPLAWAGAMPRIAVMDAYREQTLIFPSTIESFGLPLLEARAAGGLILAPNLPYAWEVLEGYPNAYFFDPASPAALAKLMADALAGRIIKRTDITTSAPPPRDGWERILRVLEQAVK